MRQDILRRFQSTNTLKKSLQKVTDLANIEDLENYLSSIRLADNADDLAEILLHTPIESDDGYDLCVGDILLKDDEPVGAVECGRYVWEGTVHLGYHVNEVPLLTILHDHALEVDSKRILVKSYKRQILKQLQKYKEEL